MSKELDILTGGLIFSCSIPRLRSSIYCGSFTSAALEISEIPSGRIRFQKPFLFPRVPTLKNGVSGATKVQRRRDGKVRVRYRLPLFIVLLADHVFLYDRNKLIPSVVCSPLTSYCVYFCNASPKSDEPKRQASTLSVTSHRRHWGRH